MRLALKLHLPIEPLVRQTVFWQFCGGENIEACRPTIARLHHDGVGTILDYSVEGSSEETSLDATCRELLRTIEEAYGNPAIPFTVFKVSGIIRFGLLEKPDGSDEWKRGVARFHKLGAAAEKAGVRLLVDAEETWIQDTIDSLAEELMAKINTRIAIAFNTVQMYRHDRLAYLDRAIAHAKKGGYQLGLKIVRGAYLEKERERAQSNGYPSPLYADKNATDEAYNEALRVCIGALNGLALCAGTHNDRSTLLLAELMERNGISKSDSRVWFAQLLGMSDHLSYNLAAAGYNVAKYVPYGPVREMIPYLTRRARENTSIKGQTSRELRLITQEIKRRKA
jgi:proline dehydrogenase